MKQLSILHLGIGRVGKAVVEQIKNQNKKVEQDLSVGLRYVGKFNSKNSAAEIQEAIARVKLPFVLIDTTASDKTYDYISQALKRGGFTILANKKPLSGSQEDFDLLQTISFGRMFYESTVGAGLPLIKTLHDFVNTGDEILEVQGCFSGTLGFLFSQIDKGSLFSSALMQAKELGYIEPDPRDDLSGKDVARKALILARVMNQKIELDQIELASLYPNNMQELSCENFLEQAHVLNALYTKKAAEALSRKKVLRFVAKVNHVCRVGLEEIDQSTEIGNLNGTDNIFVIKSRRYFNNPLVIKGPGAGVEVTAAGVFSDLLAVARRVNVKQ